MDDELEPVRQEIEKLFPGGFTLRDEANAIVASAFRNGPIEDLLASYAGTSWAILALAACGELPAPVKGPPAN